MKKQSLTVVSLGVVLSSMFLLSSPRTNLAWAQDEKEKAGGAGESGRDQKKPEFPPFDQVSKDYEKVVSTADGAPSLYTLWIDKKRNQVLAELPRGWENQKYLVAVTQASGGVFAGLQGPDAYVYWKRYDNRLALLAPELGTRSTGEPQSKSSVDRLFTDRVLLDVPIVAMGPSNQPVIDLDDLFLTKGSAIAGEGGRFGMGGGGPGANPKLAQVVKCKAFPQNIEVALESPNARGQLVTMHYSISLIPDNTGYKPREADERVGYFTTVYRDLGQYDEDKKWTRYIDRWHIEKRDPKLKLSPPKEPIVFYIEHTVPVRYRRWIRDGILYWNEAFKAVGIDNAIEVQYQDKETKAHMEKDPEDVRYNFIRWLNNDISTAIGPHRANPITGQILDADVVLTDGWIRAYWGWYHEDSPDLAVEGMSAETLQWLQDHPDWDPRLLLASPQRKQQILALRAQRKARLAAGENLPALSRDPVLMYDQDHAAIAEWIGAGSCAQERYCMAAHGLAFDMAFAQGALDLLGLLDDPNAAGPEGDKSSPDKPKPQKEETLDGIPESFVGPLLSELVCHEVGHTLGLRHNFKASSLYTLAQINSNEWKGKKPLAGSVMDYLPPNFNFDSGEIQGDYTMISIGPYDKWAIEYGYTFDDPKKVAARCAEAELAYLTDDDTGGCDPLARRYDFSANPLDYAHNQMRIVSQQRAKLLDRFVKEGQSWSKARSAYERTLGMQIRVISMMAGWVGGSHVNRDRKGDPGGRAPVQVVDTPKQRAALQFVIDHSMSDKVFGITPELLQYLTVDKWTDDSPGDRSDSHWPLHDRVQAVQASVLSMIMNPTVLKRAYDNEFRIPAEQDALTVAEIMQKMVDAVYGELDTKLDGNTFTTRQPMVSSLRRNLQAEMTSRLTFLALDTTGMPRTIRTLALQHLRTLNAKLDALLAKSSGGQIDEYTLAHLNDLNDRVDKALNSIQVTTGIR